MTEPYPYPGILSPRSAVEHSAVVDGVTTYWWEYPAARGAETIVMVHGFRGDHHGLELFADALPEFRIIIPDLPAFGASGTWADGVRSIEDYGRWLRSFLKETNTTGAVVLGHSFGSIVVSNALRGTRRSPIVLVNPIAERALSGPKKVLVALGSSWYVVGGALPVAWGNTLLSLPWIVRVMSVLLVKSRDAKIRRWIHEQHARYFSLYSDRDSLIGAYRVSISNSVGDFAAELDAPVLLVAADQDDITPLSAQFAVQKAFPNAELSVIEGVGHLVHYEKPVETAAVIREFLGRR